MRIATGLLILTMSGCATDIVAMDAGTYMIARRSAQVGGGPPVKAQAKVYQEASDYCAKQNRVVETVKLDLDDGYIAHPGSVKLQFRCVSKPS
jgi:hypothetical protein